MRVYLVEGKVGSCSLLLRGRLQRRFQFLLLQLLSNLRSEDFKQVVVVLILFTCKVSWSAGGGFNFPKEEEEEDHCCGGRHPRCRGHCLCEAGIISNRASHLVNFLRMGDLYWHCCLILKSSLTLLMLLHKIEGSVKRKIIRLNQKHMRHAR